MKKSNTQVIESIIKYHDTCDLQDTNYITDLVIQSFTKIAPFWPLKNLIAVNPLQGFEDLPIEEALKIASAYFEQKDLPENMKAVNRESIKWLQAYFDNGQSTIKMPFRTQGLYASWKKLAIYDVKLHNNDPKKQHLLQMLPTTSEQAIAECLLRLGIAKEEHVQFLTLMLATLPGWASYIKYRTEWARTDSNYLYPVSQKDYIAIRLIITSVIWPEANILIDWYKKSLTESFTESMTKYSPLEKIKLTENLYRKPLLAKLAAQPIKPLHIPEAQLVFCIDVRSEPFRKTLESLGNYQTFGFAGFFGIPVKISNTITNESFSSCPVLISPQHEIKETTCSHENYKKYKKGYKYLVTFKRLYQSVKYNFTTPFALVESIGVWSGIWMGLRSLTPKLAYKLKKIVIKDINKSPEIEPLLHDISLKDQYSYAQTALKMIGLTSHFAPMVVFCGHGSTTQNNAYATALNCGACGANHGGSNARILAAILNCQEIREKLAYNGIVIPKSTIFVAAEHNTTTDEVSIYGTNSTIAIRKLKENLETARIINSELRFAQMEQNSYKLNKAKFKYHTWLRSQDWAQVRPEWGLARNAAFIVAPRDLTCALNLEGRCFLHSYDYNQDPEGKSLTTILTAPMVVGQWINAQYLFSTLDNIAYGGGSKVTKNITGKIGIMQGNASDLMTGLPLQSIYSSDTKAYHEIQRLMTVVFAPLKIIEKIIHTQPILQKLFGNGWVYLACIEPNSRQIFSLNRQLTWQPIN